MTIKNNFSAPALLLGLLLHVSPSFASSVCSPFAALGTEVKRCEDNFALGNLAVECLKKVTADIQTGKARIKKFLQARNAALKDKQNKAFDTSDASYTDLERELTRMIANGKDALASVGSYRDQLYFPEDWDNPAILGMSSAEYLKTEPCFAVPRSVIDGTANTLTKLIADFSRTQSVASSKGDISELFSKKVKAATGTTKVLKQSPSAMAPSVKGATAAGSNISETTRKAPQAPASSSPKKQQ